MTTAIAKESAELARLHQDGKELGASFLPLSKRQAAVVRTILIGSIDTSRTQRSEA